MFGHWVAVLRLAGRAIQMFAVRERISRDQILRSRPRMTGGLGASKRYPDFPAGYLLRKSLKCAGNAQSVKSKTTLRRETAHAVCRPDAEIEYAHMYRPVALLFRASTKLRF
jgi:hypothetical protein